ncbi:DUF1385 domain-containing protein [Desulfosporosinus sp. BG]|uniref:DUF1385 domain-containing protein n=1 Tax=Desulfosporosinus sp. BG TaxID=1633135 RepID=UPI001FA7B0ED|nr:DUF1385 domain-containing protein [Desulfosporosinus sp. BG]
MRRLAVIGGRAHINGITFATNTHVVRGKLSQGKISINVSRLPGIRIFNLMDKIPFLRGVSRLAKLNLKLFLAMILLLITPWDWIFPPTEMSATESVWPVLAIYGIVLITLVFLLKRLWQFHGAEHKAFNIYTSGADLSLSAVKGASRVSERCGTNLVVILLPILILLTVVTYQMPLFVLIVSISIGYEIFNWSSRRQYLKRAFQIAAFIQKYIVTAEPTEEQMRVAIATLAKAIECEERIVPA